MHQEMRAAEGLDPRGFGNDLWLRERSRDVWAWLWLDALGRDLRYALRLLRRSPGFAAVAVLSLAVALGANSAVFSLTEAIVLPPLPVANPGELFTAFWASHNWSPPDLHSTADYRDPQGRIAVSVFSYPLWLQWRRDAGALLELAGFQRLSALDVGSGTGAAQRVQGVAVSGNFDSVLGLGPALGRGISVADNRPSAPLVAEIGYAFWNSRKESMAASYLPQRTLALSCAGFGIVVLLLAAIGLYGLTAYALVRRTREIAIRRALGATGASIARLLFGELLLVVGLGVATGIALALAFGQLLTSVMFRLSPRDPATLAAAAAFLFVVAALAAALPAWRAARLNPALVLRQE